MGLRTGRWLLIALVTAACAELMSAGCSSSSTNTSPGGGGASGTATGGAPGGGGGVTGGTAGTGGVAASGGAADSGVPATVCALTCSSNEDCKLSFDGSTLQDVGLKCNTTTGSCFSCTQASDCVPLHSGWLFPCANDADCNKFVIDGATTVCIEVGTTGRCAFAATNGCGQKFPAGNNYLPPDVVSMNHLGAGGMVDVCSLQTSADCVDNECRPSCVKGSVQGNTFCNNYIEHTSKCAASGECQCLDAGDCVGHPRGGACLTNGKCGCKTSTDCGEGVPGKTCINGYCSCSSHQDCATIKKDGFINLSAVCVSVE